MKTRFSSEELAGIDLEGFNISDIERFLKPGSMKNFSSLFPEQAAPNQTESLLKIFFYSLSFIAALFGNCLVIGLILVTKSLRTVFNFYIVNLATSDLMVALFCMWVHLATDLAHKYPFSKTVCTLSTFLQVLSVTVSILTLTTIILDRFIATIFPAFLGLTQRLQKVFIFMIWLTSVLLSLPWALYTKLVEFDWAGGHEQYCLEIFPSDSSRRMYMTCFTGLVYGVPVVLMTVMTLTTTVYTVRRRPPDRPSTEVTLEMRRKTQQILGTVLVTFVVCWTPQQATLLWDVYRDPDKPKPANIAAIKYVALYLAYTKSAVNPVIYCVFNACFRHVLWKFVRCRFQHTTETRIQPGMFLLRLRRSLEKRVEFYST